MIHQTNLMFEARKATIDVEVLNLTELGEKYWVENCLRW